MTNQLSFHSKTLIPIIKDGQTWLTAKDLSLALGYATSDAVTKVFNRNQDEFTAGMTETPNLGVSSNLRLNTHIFSLHGCHLIAMFSRTKEAKSFRHWVLNILDKEIKQPEQPKQLKFEKVDIDKRHQKNYQLINDMIAHMELPNRPVVVSYVDIANLILDTRHIQKSTLNLLKACDGIDNAINNLKTASGKGFGDFE